MKQLSPLSWIWRVWIIVFAVIGLFLQLWPNQLYNLTYYTLLSNILVVGFVGYLLFLMRQRDIVTLSSERIIRLKASVTMAITLTFLVYAILLAPIAEPEDFYSIKNYTLHYIVPIMMIIDWLVSDKRGQYRKYDPFLWTIIPLLYMIFSLIKGIIFKTPIPDQKESPFPYFFLNINKIGWSGFFKYAIAIFILYVLLGYIVYSIKMINYKDKK